MLQKEYESLSLELRKRKDLAFMELQSPNPCLNGFDKTLLNNDEIAEYIVTHENCIHLIYNMSERIQRKYLDRLPQNIQDTIKEQLHM